MHPQKDSRILLDARPTMGGVARYTYELGQLIQCSSYQNQVDLYGRRKDKHFLPTSSASGLRSLLRPILGGGKRILSDQVLLPLAAFQRNADLIHSTNYLVPLWTSKPVVITCHDLALLDFFSTKKAGGMKYYERFVLLNGLHRASHIIAPSKTVATELEQRFHFPAKKITAIYPPLPSFCLAHPAKNSVHDQSTPPSPFFLSVGTIEPRKNISHLLLGWREAYAQCRIPLVIVGQYGWQQRQLIEEQLRVTDGLYWLQNIDDITLSALYRRATALVQYSLAEGFDYPVAEALCMGTPVVASDIGVHREVMAGCGLLASTTEPAELTTKLLEVLSWSSQALTAFKNQARQQANILKQHSTIDPYISLYRRILRQPVN